MCLLPSRTFTVIAAFLNLVNYNITTNGSSRLGHLHLHLLCSHALTQRSEREIHTSLSPLDSDAGKGGFCYCGAWSFPMFSPPPPYFWVHPWLVLRFRGRRQFTGPGSTSSHQSYRGERNVFLLSPTPGEDGHQSKFDQCLELLNLLAWTRTDITEPQPPPQPHRSKVTSAEGI